MFSQRQEDRYHKMEITDVRIRKIDSTGKLRAVASVAFDDMFVVHDMKIIEGAQGLFIAMPSRRAPGGEYKDIAHPTNAKTRAMIQDKVIGAYKESLKDAETAEAEAPEPAMSVAE